MSPGDTCLIQIGLHNLKKGIGNYAMGSLVVFKTVSFSSIDLVIFVLSGETIDRIFKSPAEEIMDFVHIF